MPEIVTDMVIWALILLLTVIKDPKVTLIKGADIKAFSKIAISCIHSPPYPPSPGTP